MNSVLLRCRFRKIAASLLNEEFKLNLLNCYSPIKNTNRRKIDRMMKKRYFAIPILAIALHFLLSNLLYFLVERLVLDVFHIPPQQFMKYSYWGEILIYAVLILVFFTLYKLRGRKEISEQRTATNFKDVLGSLVVGFGICGISGLWIMLAEQLPSLQKSVEAMNAGAENIAGGNAFGTFMIAVIAAPVVEEILFRGIVLRSIRKFSPVWASILISSVLFGVYHLNIVQAVYATLMGIAAGILYEKKRNLLFPILVHFANNLITMLQGFAPSEVNELISIFILIMIAPAGYIVCRSLRQDKRADNVCSNKDFPKLLVRKQISKINYYKARLRDLENNIWQH